MARGRQLEPVAVAEYEILMGWQVPNAGGVHEEYDWLKVSLDGYAKPRSLFIEVKAPNRDDHLLALEQEVPEKYILQIIHQYIVSGARFAHYLSYSNYFPAAQRLAVVRVPRDEEMIAELSGRSRFSGIASSQVGCHHRKEKSCSGCILKL
jgi:predicted phage-related endonuclease